MNFPQSVQQVIKAEGGFVNHPADKGGMTIFGVSRKHHPSLWIWKQIDCWVKEGLPAKAITVKAQDNELFMACIEVVYSTLYWEPMKLDQFPNITRYPFFNCAVNIGVPRTIKMIQKLSGALVDGVLGGQTIKAVKDFRDHEELVDLFYQQWQEYYDRIIANNPSQKVFEKGWAARIKEVKKVNR